MTTRRTMAFRLLSLCLLLQLSACKADRKIKGIFVKKEIVLNVVVFNYFNRPIFDVYLNKRMIGGSASLSNSPYGQYSIVAGVVIPLGPQTLTWCLDGPDGNPRNGETVTAKNSLTLNADLIPSDANYLGVHIYPDETAEILFSEYIPEQSKRGLIFAKEFQKNAK